MRKELVEVIVALFVIVGMAFTANAYFAKSSDLVFVEASQKLHFTSHAIQELQARIWQIEAKYKSSDCFIYSMEDRQEYLRLKEKIEKLKKKESHLIQKTTKGG